MKDSAIEWTDHTFNPWHGCIKVSPGCEHCYAETLSRRFGRDIWGPAKTTQRMGMSEEYWAEPLKWNTAAAKAGRRARVFCASMADVFEDHPMVEPWRARLWRLIAATDWLDWLLLTKRPENFRAFLPANWRAEPPENVWLGTSVESQEYAEKRIPYLLDWPARVRFLSCEPLLGAVDLSKWLAPVEPYELVGHTCDWGGCDAPAAGLRMDDGADGLSKPGGFGWLPVCERHKPLHWVIAGGESGRGARAMHPNWARSLRDQCTAAGASFFFKQWGEWLPENQAADKVALCMGARHEYVDHMRMFKLGKHVAGRLLDGQEWSQWPASGVEL